MLRCVIVDDSTSFLEAASSLLSRQGLSVVGVAPSAAEAVRLVEAERPDVVLVDLILGLESGFDLARRLAEVDGELVVVLISTHAESDFADLIAATPAAGFMPKSELSGAAVRELVSARRGR